MILICTLVNLTIKSKERSKWEKLEISDDIEVNSGEMVIHDNKIAYKMEFEVLLSLSVLMDSHGNHIPTEESPERNIEQVGNEAEGLIEDM